MVRHLRRVSFGVVFVTFAAILVGTGCTSQQPEEPPKPMAPPPPTAEEIYRELRGALEPILNVGGGLDNAVRDQALASFRTAKAKHAAAENGQEAFKRITDDITNLIARAKREDRWRYVKAGIMAYNILYPGSDKYAKDERRADLMLARPTVTVRGFMEPRDGSGDIYVFLECKDNDTGKVEKVQVREGEEFYNGKLRLLRIIGDQQSVEILYVPANDSWTVKGPRERQRTGWNNDSTGATTTRA